MSEQSEILAGQVRRAAGPHDDRALSVTEIVRGMATTIARLTAEVERKDHALRALRRFLSGCTDRFEAERILDAALAQQTATETGK